ncbi:MAG: peptidoglycan editing factor PgeF [Tannerellaceae bacterium]|nr:peptidoglycan editing factor PgeF [Tannerellaceae bacterium]
MTGTMMSLKHKTIEMLQFPGLSRFCNISHFITTRRGGVSEGNYASFNLNSWNGDDPDQVCQNRRLLAEAMGVQPAHLFTPFQVHGNEVRTIGTALLNESPEKQEAFLHGVDALVTNLSDICIAVATADCVPVLFYDPDKQVIGAAHAGWRGTVAGIAGKVVHTMIEEYGSAATHIYAAIGPSIGKSCFEVGEEVVASFRAIGLDKPTIIEVNPLTGKHHIDLWEANRCQLLDAGIPPGNIEVAGICTYTHHEIFYSARRLGIKSGRFLTGIKLNG